MSGMIFAFVLAFGMLNCAFGQSVTDAQLQTISDALWRADVNRINVDRQYQTQIPSGDTADQAPLPLFPNIPPEVDTYPTFVALQNLQDNYIQNTNVDENDTPAESAEIDAFLAEITQTDISKQTFEFLQSNGYIANDEAAYSDYLKFIWFTTYTRQGALSSSGFEHVFCGEMKNGDEPDGMHDWVRHMNLEKDGSVNYYGYYNYVTLGSDTSKITHSFSLNGIQKPISGFFVGSSPEFDLSCFTICFTTRPNSLCHLKFNGQAIDIQTYTIDCAGQTGACVGTSYPV